MIRPDFAGEKKAVATTSPRPFTRTPSAPGCEVSGMMTRRMMLVLGVMPNGTTGWMLNSVPTASRSPRPKSQLACSGS